MITGMMRSMIWWRLDGWESKFSLGIWRQPKIFKCIGDREVMCFPSKKVYACANHVRCSMRVGEEVSHLVHTQENAVAESAPAKNLSTLTHGSRQQIWVLSFVNKNCHANDKKVKKWLKIKNRNTISFIR